MRLLVSILSLVIPILGCCYGGAGDAFNQGFCDGYREDFVAQCVAACVTSAGEAGRPTCVTGCDAQLVADPIYVSQCGGGATPPAPAPSAPVPPAPVSPAPVPTSTVPPAP